MHLLACGNLVCFEAQYEPSCNPPSQEVRQLRSFMGRAARKERALLGHNPTPFAESFRCTAEIQAVTRGTCGVLPCLQEERQPREDLPEPPVVGKMLGMQGLRGGEIVLRFDPGPKAVVAPHAGCGWMTEQAWEIRRAHTSFPPRESNVTCSGQ